MQKCSICHRRFTENRLVEHQRACRSSFDSSHRYHYDSSLHRWKDLDYHINTKQQQFPSPRIYWKQKHQQLQDTIKGQYHPIDNSIPSSVDDRPYQCSQCLRKFATDKAVTKHQKGCAGKRQLTIKTRHLKNKKQST